MTLQRSIVLTLAMSVAVAVLGAWAGARYVSHQLQRPTPLHELVHKRLHLSDEQEMRIAGIERQHEIRRQALEAEMRAANAQLAQALQQQHAYTPQVQAAIERFHMAMGELQKETIVHTLAMRSVLTPKQAAKFDKTVADSLTEEAR